MRYIPIAAFSLGCWLPTTALAQCEIQHLIPPPADTSGRFGHAVQMNDRHLIVGDFQGDTPCGSGTCSTGVVYAYERDSGSGQWLFTQTIFPPDVMPGDGYGKEVHLSGDRMIVGATSGDLGGIDTGGAYVYDFTGEQWEESGRLASPAAHFMTQFGRSVFIDGSVAIVMQYSQRGIVHVFEERSGVWSHAETVVPFDEPLGDSFGDAIEMTDDWLFLGAPRDDGAYSSAGSVYVYRREGPASFTLEGKIYPPDPQSRPAFGNAISSNGRTLAVGGLYSDRRYDGQGAVYIYGLQDGMWTLRQELTPDEPTGPDLFGASVALRGDRLLIGAPYFETPGGEGAAFLYTRGIDDRWTNRATLLAPEPSDAFGSYLDVSGNLAVVAAPNDFVAGRRSGSAFVFDLACFNCPADLDEDGALTIYDFLTFLNLFQDADPLADFDGDGELTIFDFLAFQTAFDAGCG